MFVYSICMYAVCGGGYYVACIVCMCVCSMCKSFSVSAGEADWCSFDYAIIIQLFSYVFVCLYIERQFTYALCMQLLFLFFCWCCSCSCVPVGVVVVVLAMAFLA